jgi:hypothetical protein
MNQEHSKLQHKQEAHQTSDLRQTSGTESGREFESPEQLLREDASTVRVPDAVEARLRRSVEENPKPRRPWWNRWGKR